MEKETQSQSPPVSCRTANKNTERVLVALEGPHQSLKKNTMRVVQTANTTRTLSHARELDMFIKSGRIQQTCFVLFGVLFYLSHFGIIYFLKKKKKKKTTKNNKEPITKPAKQNFDPPPRYLFFHDTLELSFVLCMSLISKRKKVQRKQCFPLRMFSIFPLQAGLLPQN